MRDELAAIADRRAWPTAADPEGAEPVSRSASPADAGRRAA
jgi:hypothetical protein